MVSRRVGRALPIAAVSLIVLVTSIAGDAQVQPSRRYERIAVAGIDPQLLPVSLDEKPVNVMLELSGDPVARHQAEARRQGRRLSDAERAAVRRALRVNQDRLLPQIEAAGGRVLAQLQDAYNGVKVRIARSDIAALAALPGVVGVHGIARYTPDNGQSVPYIGGPAAWTGGLTGDGVSIAVIDKGIDYFHANLGGSGDPADFASNDGRSIEAGTFPTGKVVGGTDFVGDAYDASGDGDAAIPHPDPDPLDCNGHGSHVAGTAAGNGVLINGTAYAGPYNDSLALTTDFEIAPGVAPRATIYAYRVFGCDGSTDVVAEAINQAVVDGVDVINLSLGSLFGGATDDPTTAAAENAVAAGVIVVASAGNSGPNAFLVGSPSTGHDVISVAAVDTIPELRTANIALTGGANIQAINANEHPLTSPVSGPLRVLDDGEGGIALGCSAGEYDGVEEGDIVVTLRGVCARVDRAILGEDAGAAAVIMVNNATALPPLEGPIRREGGVVEIPFLGVRSVDATALLAADGTAITVSDSGVAANPGYRGLATFTSGGPRGGDNALKPDITAPGVSNKSTGVGLGTGGVRISGTSMAAPHAAGAAALMHQANPSWTPAEVRATLMNTANGAASALTNNNPRIAGAGVIRVDRAATATTRATAPSLSYGYKPISGAYSETQTLTISNAGPSAVTYSLAAAFNGSSLGTDVTITPSSVAVPAGGSATVDVVLSLSAAEVATLPAALGAPGSITTIRGAVTATPTVEGGGVWTLRVPFLLAPRGLSDVDVNGTPTASAPDVEVKNNGIHAAEVGLYAWGQTDGADLPGEAMDLRAVGVQSLPGEAVGLPASDRLLLFAVNTHAKWSSASQNEFDIAIDVSGSPSPEYFVVGVDLGAVLSAAFDGRYGSFVFDAAGNVLDAFFADAPANGSTVVLPVAASSLGLSLGGSETFRYSATAFDLLGAEFDVADGRPRVRPWAPRLTQGGFRDLGPSEAANFTLAALPTALADGILGWMLVAHDDADGGAQADVVPLPVPGVGRR
jgi:subtilisin family serine protease